MHFKPGRSPLINAPKLLLYMLPVLLLQACAQQGNTPNLRVKQQLDVIDTR